MATDSLLRVVRAAQCESVSDTKYADHKNGACFTCGARIVQCQCEVVWTKDQVREIAAQAFEAGAVFGRSSQTGIVEAAKDYAEGAA